MKSILDNNFKYTSSVDTDLRKTFKRIRNEMARAAKPPQPPKEEQQNVVQLPKNTKTK